MMNVSRIHERLSGKLKSFLTLIKRIFRLPLRFRANSHSDVTSVRHDTDETGPVSREASKKRKRRKKKAQFQNAIACTSKVRKRILKNLVAASVSRVSPMRAKIAREILIELERNGSLTNFQPKSSPVRKDSHIEVAKPVLEVAEKPSGTKGFVRSMFGKFNTCFVGVRRWFCFDFGISKVNESAVS